jgi:RHS repeat-associated protein
VEEYRYGFNGKEEVDEMIGESNGYDFGARMYDARLGRWWSVDPKLALAPGWTTYRSFFCNPLRYLDSDGQWEWDVTGNLVAQKGDNSYSMAIFLGTSQQNASKILNRSGVYPNSKGVLNLKEGQSLSKSTLWIESKSESGIVVNNTIEATNHYLDGNGEAADVGDRTTRELLASSRFQEKHNKITSQSVEPSGYFSVDMTDETFHIGHTNVDYNVTGNGETSKVSYTLFARDGYWDPDIIDENTLGQIPIIRDWTETKPDGPGPNLERFGGKPYHYKTRERTYFYKPIEGQK